MWDLWKVVLLFVVLTPGIFLTLSPVGKRKILVAACVHALIFVVLFKCIDVEGFQGPTSSTILPPKPILPPGNWDSQTRDAHISALNAYDSALTNITSFNLAMISLNANIERERTASNTQALKGRNGNITNGTNVSCSGLAGTAVGTASIVSGRVYVTRSDGKTISGNMMISGYQSSSCTVITNTIPTNSSTPTIPTMLMGKDGKMIKMVLV